MLVESSKAQVNSVVVGLSNDRRTHGEKGRIVESFFLFLVVERRGTRRDEEREGSSRSSNDQPRRSEVFVRKQPMDL